MEHFRLSHPELLYNLLPSIYRLRDEAQGEPLRALLDVINLELHTIEADVQQLYNDWFIETCDDWVVPYIGDLLGLRGLNDEKHLLYSQRNRVANTIGYRRRKGTVATLEHVIKDVTGWQAKAVEFFELIATTQSLKHLRPARGGTVNLKNSTDLDNLGTAFESTDRTVDLRAISNNSRYGDRQIESVPGKYNICNMGIFLWRLQSYPVIRSTARQMQPGCYTFNPLGVDIPLFNQPRTQTEITHKTCAMDIPAALRRHPLQNEIDARRQGVIPKTSYFGSEPVIEVFIQHSTDSSFTAIPATEIQICDLSSWQHPIGSQAAVDPVLGRLAFPSDVTPVEVQVSYAYGFSADIGGGSYDRHSTLAIPDSDTWQAEVRRDAVTDRNNHQYSTLRHALDDWSKTDLNGIIEITDNGTYDSPSIELKGQQWLVIQASDGMCPCLRGDYDLTSSALGTSLTLNGLLIDGKIRVQGDIKLNVTHCTLKPPKNDSVGKTNASIETEGGNNLGLQVAITHSIVGAIRLSSDLAVLFIEDSIVDGGSGCGISSSSVALKRTTVFGNVSVNELTSASEVIFTKPVVVQRQQVGFIRFSYVPEGSKTPRRYHCYPDLAMDKTSNSTETTHILIRHKPSFTSVVYGHPGYAQLNKICPLEIRTGAENGSEMGVFHHLHQAQREANLLNILDEYLPYSLEAGIFYKE